MEEGCGGEVEDAMVNIKGKCTDSKFHPKGGQRMAADPQGTPHPDTLQDTSTSVQGMKGPPATMDHPQEGGGADSSAQTGSNNKAVVRGSSTRTTSSAPGGGNAEGRKRRGVPTGMY